MVVAEPSIDLTTTMSIHEYAVHRGVSDEAIRKQARKGRLVLNEARQVLVMATDALLAKVMHPTKGGRGGSRAVVNAPPAEPPTQLPGKPAAIAPADGQISYTDAARQEKQERTRLLQIDIAERTGRLVDAELVRRQSFARARQALDALMAIPDRIAPQLAAETDPHKVHILLGDELRRVAEQLAKVDTPPAGIEVAAA
jgi:hypothetical protein